MLNKFRLYRNKAGGDVIGVLHRDKNVRFYAGERCIEFPHEILPKLQAAYAAHAGQAGGASASDFGQWLEKTLRDEEAGRIFRKQGAALLDNAYPWIAYSQMLALLAQKPRVEFRVHESEGFVSYRGYGAAPFKLPLIRELAKSDHARLQKQIDVLPAGDAKRAELEAKLKENAPMTPDEENALHDSLVAAELLSDGRGYPVVRFEDGLPAMLAEKGTVFQNGGGYKGHLFRVVSDELYRTRYDDLPATAPMAATATEFIRQRRRRAAENRLTA